VKKDIGKTLFDLDISSEELWKSLPVEAFSWYNIG
jgi:hypothetical protein